MFKFKVNFHSNIVETIKSKKFIVIFNFVATMIVLLCYLRLFYIDKIDKINKLQSNHLKLAGYLLLDYYDNCQKIPENFENIDTFNKCIQMEYQNFNFNDIYNRPLALIKLDSNFYMIANFDNGTFFKSKKIVKILPRPVLVDLKKRKVTYFSDENSRLTELFEVRRYILATKKFTPHPSIPE